MLITLATCAAMPATMMGQTITCTACTRTVSAKLRWRILRIKSIEASLPVLISLALPGVLGMISAEFMVGLSHHENLPIKMYEGCLKRLRKNVVSLVVNCIHLYEIRRSFVRIAENAILPQTHLLVLRR